MGHPSFRRSQTIVTMTSADFTSPVRRPARVQSVGSEHEVSREDREAGPAGLTVGDVGLIAAPSCPGTLRRAFCKRLSLFHDYCFFQHQGGLPQPLPTLVSTRVRPTSSSVCGGPTHSSPAGVRGFTSRTAVETKRPPCASSCRDFLPTGVRRRRVVTSPPARCPSMRVVHRQSACELPRALPMGCDNGKPTERWRRKATRLQHEDLHSCHASRAADRFVLGGVACSLLESARSACSRC
jgi:hypothetical protein